MIISDISTWLENDLLAADPSKWEREFILRMQRLVEWHLNASPKYKKLLTHLKLPSHPFDAVSELEGFPFIPVSLFKDYDIKSIDDESVFKLLKSSGTSGTGQSKIYLDKANAKNQSLVLTQIMKKVFDHKARLPMLIIDSPSVLSERSSFSARGAAIIGFSMYGKNATYALKENMEIDYESIENFLSRYSGENIFIFGFTYIIWKYFVSKFKGNSLKFGFPKGILLHGGGWKKMNTSRVSKSTFNEVCSKVFGLKKIVNYYGMVEQTGSLFTECSQGYLHSTSYSTILTRSVDDLSALPPHKVGLVQLLSMLPTSYPGHSLLTEDLGVIRGKNDCKCGLPGTYFEILGRLSSAELRGCSDTRA